MTVARPCTTRGIWDQGGTWATKILEIFSAGPQSPPVERCMQFDHISRYSHSQMHQIWHPESAHMYDPVFPIYLFPWYWPTTEQHFPWISIGQNKVHRRV